MSGEKPPPPPPLTAVEDDDATSLDRRVRDLASKLEDGAYLRANAPAPGAKSIYDDFEAALKAAPRLSPDDDAAGVAINAGAIAAGQTKATSAGVVDLADLSAFANADGVGGEVVALQDATDELFQRMLRDKPSVPAKGSDVLEHVATQMGFDGVAADGVTEGGTRGGGGGGPGGAGGKDDEELKGMMATLLAQLREERRQG